MNEDLDPKMLGIRSKKRKSGKKKTEIETPGQEKPSKKNDKRRDYEMAAGEKKSAREKSHRHIKATPRSEKRLGKKKRYGKKTMLLTKEERTEPQLEGVKIIRCAEKT